MSKKIRQIIALFALFLLLTPMVLVPIEAEAASAFYGEYTDVAKIYDYGSCPGMQGLAVGSQMLYTVKVNSNDTQAVIKMTDKDTGETTTLYNADAGSYYFTYLDHANDMDVWGIDGYSNLFVATTKQGADGIVRLKRSGDSLYKVASYRLVCDGEDICATAMGIMGVSNGMISFITKWGMDIYTGSVSTSVSSGTIQMKKLCTISKSKVYIKGEYLDLSSFVNQGMGYYNNTLFVPISGDDNWLERSVIMVFNLDGVLAGSTIYPSEELVFRVTSGTYSALCEFESCGISSDGRLYFNANRRVTNSDTNHDGVAYFDGYTFSKLTQPAKYHHYTVRYDAEGGTGTMENTTVPYGVGTALRANSFTKPGYQFAGWTAYRTTKNQWYYTDGTSTGWYTEGSQPSGWTKAIYDDQQKVSATTSVDGDVVVMHAQWEAASTYVVKFEDEDGTLLKSIMVASGTVPTPPADPAKASDGIYSYTFAGWNPAVGLVNQNTTYTATYTAEVLPTTPTEPAVIQPGTVEPYLERVTSGSGLVEGVPYVISDYKDSWLHYVLTSEKAQKTAGGLTHTGLLLDGKPSVYETDLWYIKGGNLVYGSANSNQYLRIYFDSSNQGVVEIGSYDADKVATLKYHSDDEFIIGSAGGYLNRHGGTANDFIATTYQSVGGSYWHLDRLCQNQVAGISLSAADSNVTVGNTLQLMPTVNVDGISTNNYTVSWDVNNSSVAAVSSSGLLTAQSTGTVTVTATLTAVNGHELLVPITDTYAVTVNSAAVSHNYRTVVIAPTCTTGGYTTHRCTICGDTYQSDPTLATGHSYKSVVIAPTCTTQGYTSYTCTVCGNSYQGTYTNATGHNYKSVVTKPTCTTQGHTTFTCSVCGISYKDQITNPTGHSYKTTTVSATCTTAGSVTKTCSNCGDKQVTTIPATGHSFANGSCSTCGAADPSYQPAVTKPTLTLKSPTLEFKDMITVNAFYTAENVQDVVEMGMLTYSTKVSAADIATAEHIIPGATFVESSGRYYSSSQGIHAKYLADTVYLAIYAKLSDGSYAYSKVAGYSAVQYANSQLKNSADTKLKQLVVAMLNYGAEAQLYFGHNTGSLANATLTADQKALPAAYHSGMVGAVPSTSATKQGIFANNQGFASRKPAISFEGAFCINYFFTPKYTPDNGITLYYWNEADYNANSVLSTSNATGKFKLEGSGTGEYRGDITGIAAKELSGAVFVAAVYKNGGTVWTSGVLGYSIGAYCSSQASKGGTIADLAKATAVYGYHAKAYFG